MRNPIQIVRNDNIPEMTGDDAVFRWGCASSIVYEGQRPITYNKSSAIHACNNKRDSRLAMQDAHVSVPRTWDAHYVFGPESPFGGGFVTGARRFVLRPEYHAQGRHLWVGTDNEILAAIREHNVFTGYVSELIDKVAEYRVYVIQGRIACVAQKTPGNPQDVAWNVARGGRFDNVRFGNWPLSAIREALLAAVVVGTDFCGVDVMMDREGRAYVLEVNSAPSLTSPYRQQCFAKCFDWILDGKEVGPFLALDTWRDVVHPAIAPT
jgi:glutathione synthase/RimK-type ligase-like ATP-grasp enzyme